MGELLSMGCLNIIGVGENVVYIWLGYIFWIEFLLLRIKVFCYIVLKYIIRVDNVKGV